MSEQITTQNSEPSFDKVWLMFQETGKQINELKNSFKETDKRFKETDKRFKETDKILQEKFKETDEKFKETAESFKETDKKFQETDKILQEKFKETDDKIRQLAGLFAGQWGKLVEALLGPGCLQMFQEKGIEITQTQTNIVSKKNGDTLEIDILLVNSTVAVVVEIKTSAGVKHIKKLRKDLENFKKFFPHYSDCKVYGAIAALRFNEQSDKFANSKGLFVIKATGDNLMKFDNSYDFKPKSF